MPIVFDNITLNNINIVGAIPPTGAQAYTTPGTYSWTVPDGVTSVSVVCIGGGGMATASGSPGERDGTNSSFGSAICEAGGGKGCSASYGAGGAGGTVIYGTGGPGGDGGSSGGPGAGGNYGAGGAACNYGGTSGGGGGVGILGFGASGAGGSGPYGNGGNGTNGGGGGGGSGNGANYGQGGRGGSGGANGETGSNLGGGLYGGGCAAGYFLGGGGGGAAAWANNISVTPGQTIQVIVGRGGRYSAGSGGFGANSGAGAVRIVWPGTTRQFPSTNVGA